MDLKSGTSRLPLSKLLAEHYSQVCKDCGFDSNGADLKVEKGETVRLAFESERFRAAHRQRKPRSIEEVRQLIGSAVAAQPGANTACGCSKSGKLLNPEDLESQDPKLRGQAFAAARLGARQYVMGGAAVSASQRFALDRYIELSNAVLNIAFLLDIDIQDGATLVIAPTTHALYARNIHIHGSGRIVCEGPATINCRTLNGDYRTKYSSISANPVLINNITLAKQP
jgi:hypothetical protein